MAKYRTTSAAEIAGVTPAELRRLLAAGLPLSGDAERWPGGHRFYTPADIMTLAVAGEAVRAGFSVRAAVRAVLAHQATLAGNIKPGTKLAVCADDRSVSGYIDVYRISQRLAVTSAASDPAEIPDNSIPDSLEEML